MELGMGLDMERGMVDMGLGTEACRPTAGTGLRCTAAAAACTVVVTDLATVGTVGMVGMVGMAIVP